MHLEIVYQSWFETFNVLKHHAPMSNLPYTREKVPVRRSLEVRNNPLCFGMKWTAIFFSV